MVMAQLNPAFEDRPEYHAAFVLYQEWYQGGRVPMPHWKDLPEASKDALARVAERVIQAYKDVGGV
jgi:hypothetical protein